MLKDNLVQLRKLHNMTQEDLADLVGVTRQSVAKWESGESVPDLEKCKIIADNFGISLDDLANYSSSDNLGLDLPPKGKHLFGIVTVGDKGQVVIPAKARKIFDIKPGDQVVILGDEGQGLAVLKAKHFLDLADRIKKNMGNS